MEAPSGRLISRVWPTHGNVSDSVGAATAPVSLPRLAAIKLRFAPSSRALASCLQHAIFAGRLMVFEATVYLRREHLAVLAAVDMRLTGYLFLWVIDVECVLVRGTTLKAGMVEGFLHFQCPQ